MGQSRLIVPGISQGNAFYTEDMRREVHKSTKPCKFVLDVVELPDGLMLRVYQDDVIRFTDSERFKILEYLAEVQKSISKFGVKCAVQSVPGRPPGIN